MSLRAILLIAPLPGAIPPTEVLPVRVLGLHVVGMARLSLVQRRREQRVAEYLLEVSLGERENIRLGAGDLRGRIPGLS